ncbi:MAG: acetyl-CoA acetyltransferase [Rhodococcus sp. (in: high G+C Gram-positive bacteria)]
MTTDPRRVPVIVGVADLRSGRAGHPAPPIEPLELVLRAAREAVDDSGVPALSTRLDAIHAIRTTSWAYDDLPSLVAEALGSTLRSRSTSAIGGHYPAMLLDRIGSDIADGTTDVALLIGAEAQASVKAATKAGTDPATLGWVCEPGGPPTFGDDDLGSAPMQRAGILAPVQIYPLFENGRAHARGVRPAATRRESAELYASFSAVAAGHPVAWSPEERTAERIASVDASNRAVSECYPLAMNAMPFVDQAAAVLVCSLAVAREMGVDESRLIYLWGGAGASDTSDVLSRTSFDFSPALRSAVRRTLSQAGITASDLAFVDAYSCFPVVPKLLMDELQRSGGLTPTVLGGHSFFGGPLSSYSLHAVAETTRLLRHSPDVAMVHANGGYLTHQHTVLLAGTAHVDGYVGDPAHEDPPTTGVEIATGYSGPATIETATVMYGRDGEPETALVVAKTPKGQRVAGRTDANFAVVLAGLIVDDDISPVGLSIQVSDHDGVLSVAVDEGELR